MAIMTTMIDNDINKMLDLYRQCDEEYDEIMEIMDAHYVRATLGYVSNYWTKRQRKDILSQFQDIVDRRYKVRCDIHEYYLKMIEETPEGKGQAVVSAELTKFEKIRCRKSHTWTSTLETSMRKKITSNRKKLPKFTQILRIMKIRFGCNN